MQKYTEILAEYAYTFNQEAQEKLRSLANYAQVRNTDVSKYYKVIDADPFESFEWDVPIPPPNKALFTFVDLLCGIGGVRIAMQNLGGICVFANEVEEYASKEYTMNYGQMPYGDIRKIDKERIPEHDILVASFPNKTFENRMHKHGSQSIFGDVLDIIKLKKPKAFLFEFPKGIVKHNNYKTFSLVMQALRYEIKYYVPSPKVLNAKDFGLPQKRERLYIIGFRGNLGIKSFVYPKGSRINTSIANILEKDPVDDKYYLTKEQIASFSRYKILAHDDIANPLYIRTNSKELNLVEDSKGVRYMTPREWLRLQGFPEQFTINSTDRFIYPIIAVSSPVPVIQSLGSTILKTLSAN